MEIRTWQESDRPFLRTLYLHARRESWPWLQGERWRLEDFDAETLGEKIWVALDEGRRVGFASVLESDNFLHCLFVDPDAQNRGVGSALLKHVQRQFSGTGALKCLAKNERALAFYERHGWQPQARGESEQGEYVLMHYRLP